MTFREERVQSAMSEIISQIEELPVGTTSCHIIIYVYLGINAVLSNVREVCREMFTKEMIQISGIYIDNMSFTINFERMFKSKFYEDIEVEVKAS